MSFKVITFFSILVSCIYADSNIYQKKSNWVMKAEQPVGSDPAQVYLEWLGTESADITPIAFQGYNLTADETLWVMNLRDQTEKCLAVDTTEKGSYLHIVDCDLDFEDERQQFYIAKYLEYQTMTNKASGLSFSSEKLSSTRSYLIMNTKVISCSKQLFYLAHPLDKIAQYQKVVADAEEIFSEALLDSDHAGDTDFINEQIEFYNEFGGELEELVEKIYKNHGNSN